MTTLPTTTEPKANNHRITRAEFSYICKKNQHAVYDLLVKSVRNSGVTQKKIAEITGIDESTISRLLSRPRNIELDTLSKIVYASVGAALSISERFPGSTTQRLGISLDQLEFTSTSAIPTSGIRRVGGTLPYCKSVPFVILNKYNNECELVDA